MTINCKGKLMDLSQPKIMGIVNLTPDSFYDGGQIANADQLVQKVGKMLEDGATFIDIGGYSSRPGADHVSEDEELHRILPAVNLILKEYPNAYLSIDTFRSRVATKCLQVGATLINDISAGLLDENMFDVIAKFKVPIIMMHMRGTPQNMVSKSGYNNIAKDLISYFSERVALANQKQINDIIIDPGFGFAKKREQNYELLSKLKLFESFEIPILVGLSRKSMIYKTLNTNPAEALNGTTALHMVALMNGANILRVHDVKEAKECITLFEELTACTNSI
ncbi:MAG: dihydropteroate synthase [Croceitalea sp.]|nr:dihydropteroate synthase [Croceitalea sp.]